MGLFHCALENVMVFADRETRALIALARILTSSWLKELGNAASTLSCRRNGSVTRNSIPYHRERRINASPSGTFRSTSSPLAQAKSVARSAIGTTVGSPFGL